MAIRLHPPPEAATRCCVQERCKVLLLFEQRAEEGDLAAVVVGAFLVRLGGPPLVPQLDEVREQVLLARLVDRMLYLGVCMAASKATAERTWPSVSRRATCRTGDGQQELWQRIRESVKK